MNRLFHATLSLFSAGFWGDCTAYHLSEFFEAYVVTPLAEWSDGQRTLSRGAAGGGIGCRREATDVSIAEIQGSGATSPLVGQWVWTSGIVSEAFVARGELNGFFIETETAADPAEVEKSPRTGLFIQRGQSRFAPVVGERLRLRGRIEEPGAMTALKLGDARRCGRATLAPPLALPQDASRPLEAFEGLRVALQGRWRVVDNHELGHFGAVALAAETAPDQRLVLDDRARHRFAPQLADLGLDGALPRVDATVTGVQGVLTEAYGGYRLRPLTDGPRPTWQVPPVPAPPRPPGSGPAPSLRVVSLNAFNYFVTLEKRGAKTPEGFALQHAKLSALLAALDGDIVALQEVEARSATATAKLAEALAAATGRATRFIPPPTGADEVGNALIYHPKTRTGNMTVSAELPRSCAHAEDSGRPPPMYRLRARHAEGSAELELTVVHLKSRGGCHRARGRNRDKGHGCWDARRQNQVRALLRCQAEGPGKTPRRAGQADSSTTATAPITAGLIVGDWNALAEEPPLLLATQAGWRNLTAEAPATERLSYVFKGEAQLIDHALWRPGPGWRVAQTRLWSINAKMPAALGYTDAEAMEDALQRLGRKRELAQWRQRWLPAARLDQAQRASDHDPIIVDLELDVESAIAAQGPR